MLYREHNTDDCEGAVNCSAEVRIVLIMSSNEYHFIHRKICPDNNWNFIHNYQFVYTINGHDYQLLDDYQYMYPNTIV